MKPFTLMRLTIVSATLPLCAAAQVAPAAPAKPARPPKTPPPVEAPALPDPFLFELPPMPSMPRGPMELRDLAPLLGQLDQLRFQDFDFRAQEMDVRAHDLGLRAEELAQKTLSRIDVDQLKRNAEDMVAHIDVDKLTRSADEMRFRAEEIAQRALVDLPEQLRGLGPLTGVSGVGPLTIWKADKLMESRPRAP